jgi:hypothetical protein
MSPPPPPRWLRVPLSPEATRWGSLRTARTILVVVRTMTTLSWLSEILPELLDDLRIQVLFTLAEGSAYQDGVAEAVHSAGGRFVPWEQAAATPFALAICASYFGKLEELHSPLLLLPHGPGYTRDMSAPVDGVPPLPATSANEPARTTVVLSHGEQEQQWASTVGLHTVVAGDPCFDALRASLSDRQRYREALGVDAGQKLVVTSSTWGPGSLLAQRPDLWGKLLAELPVDEYVIASIFHANIWIGHGPWQVRLWLRRALDGGLRLIPYLQGWRAAVVAADCVIGDHGSVTFYAGTLGIPVLLATFADNELVDGTALAEFGQRAPRLPQTTELRAVIDSVSGPPEGERYADLARRMFAFPGHALQRLQVIIYELLELDLPARRARVLPVPLPTTEWQPATAHLVVAEIRWPSADESPKAVIERYPAALEPSHLESATGRHLAVTEAEQDHRLRESAAVIVCVPAETEAGAMSAISAALTRYPGCYLAVVRLGEIIWIGFHHRDWLAVKVDTTVGEDIVGSGLYVLALDGFLDDQSLSSFQLIAGPVLTTVTTAASGARQSR